MPQMDKFAPCLAFSRLEKGERPSHMAQGLGGEAKLNQEAQEQGHWPWQGEGSETGQVQADTTRPKSDAYVQLKDHKQNFRNNPTFRLVNTNKSELGRVAKQKLQEINTQVKNSFQSNQWRNTQEVIS